MIVIYETEHYIFRFIENSLAERDIIQKEIFTAIDEQYKKRYEVSVVFEWLYGKLELNKYCIVKRETLESFRKIIKRMAEED